ncbi:hypothetical protein [Pseudomonas sp. WS 5011]|uniref:hypothetical protein n=1 Tax=Pseudomonas sp. WS 5011 TaxID=2717477 RepID=UPI0014734D85|nr:hypothetical protein [Pseudomonas sp. WS 5011]NMY50443.1 hypothetical protein [Pseudomonas sp. WS 5011]
MKERQLLKDAYDRNRWKSVITIANSMSNLERVCAIVELSMHIKSRRADLDFEHKLTAEDKRTLVATARFIGYECVLFDISQTPVINDMELVAHLLSNLDERHGFKAHKACIDAIKAGQHDIAIMLVEWLIRIKYSHVEVYGIFISAYSSRIMSRKIFDIIVMSGYIVPILNQARVGLMDLHSNFIELVAGLDDETKIKVFEKL